MPSPFQRCTGVCSLHYTKRFEVGPEASRARETNHPTATVHFGLRESRRGPKVTHDLSPSPAPDGPLSFAVEFLTRCPALTSPVYRLPRESGATWCSR